MIRLARLSILIFAAGLAGCVYDAPITAQPTGPVDAAALGDWVSADGKIRLKVRRLAGNQCILSLNGMLFRAWRSDVAGMRLASVQDIDTDKRKFAWLTWQVSPDGNRLTWRSISQKVVPPQAASSAEGQALLEANRDNAKLFDAAQVYVRDKKP